MCVCGDRLPIRYPKFLQHVFLGADDAMFDLDAAEDPETKAALQQSDEHDAMQRIRFWLWDVGQEVRNRTGTAHVPTTTHVPFCNLTREMRHACRHSHGLRQICDESLATCMPCAVWIYKQDGVNTGASTAMLRGGATHSYAGGVAEQRALELVRLKRQQPARLPQLRDAFQQADVKNAGRLTRVQFRRALSTAGAPVADQVWPMLLDAAVAWSSQQQEGLAREEERQRQRAFGNVSGGGGRVPLPSSARRGGAATPRQTFDGYIDYELFIRTLLSGDRGQGGRGSRGARSLTIIRTRVLDAVYVAGPVTILVACGSLARSCHPKHGDQMRGCGGAARIIAAAVVVAVAVMATTIGGVVAARSLCE